MNDKPEPCQLYLISPPKINLETFPAQLEDILKTGAVTVFQLRLKGCSDDDVKAATKVLMPLCRTHAVPFILNDSPELAATLVTDGVHIGEEDTSLKEARSVVGDDVIIGVSCYDSKDKAMTLAGNGADYVAFGAMFDTNTKQAKTKAEPELLTWWSTYTHVPCVAIGGITLENAKTCIDAGADFLAVIGGVWNADDPAEAAQQFKDMMKPDAP